VSLLLSRRRKSPYPSAAQISYSESQRAAYAATRTLDSCAGTQTSKREVRRKILLRKISNCGGERFRICDCCNSRVSTQKLRSAHEGQIVLEGLIKQWCIQFLRAFQSIASYSKHTRPITSPKQRKHMVSKTPQKPPYNPITSSLKIPSSFSRRPSKRMRLSIQNPLIQADHILRLE
jgi:hypothetical protein